jgi:serine protease Do
MQAAFAAAVLVVLSGCARPGSTFPATYTLPGTVGQIMKGQAVSGQLSLTDSRLSDNSVYQAWTYIGTRGERIEVDVTSSSFDAYAILEDASGKVLARDDDSGGGTNARIVFTVPAAGAYRIIANTYRQGSYGAYTLSVRELSGGR